jgi:hypothetical protein
MHIPVEAYVRNNKTSIARQRISKQAFSKIEMLCFLRGPCRVVIKGEGRCVESGSNTSTVALRVVGSGEKGSFESERVKYGRKSQGTRTREWLRWRGPAAMQTIDSSFHQRERPISTNPQMSDSNKNLVISLKWVLYSKQTGRPTVGRNIRLRLTRLSE